MEPVIIDGSVVQDERRLTTADEAAIVTTAQRAASSLARPVPDLRSPEEGLVFMTRQGLN